MTDGRAVRPLILVESGSATWACAVAKVRDAGREVIPGWPEASSHGGRSKVAVGVVVDRESAAAAVRTAVDGYGLVVDGQGERELLDAVCDDLRRLGSVCHVHDELVPAGMDGIHEDLLDLVGQGRRIKDIGTLLNLAPRTVHRRLHEARDAYGVDTNAEVLQRRRSLRAVLAVPTP